MKEVREILKIAPILLLLACFAPERKKEMTLPSLLFRAQNELLKPPKVDNLLYSQSEPGYVNKCPPTLSNSVLTTERGLAASWRARGGWRRQGRGRERGVGRGVGLQAPWLTDTSAETPGGARWREREIVGAGSKRRVEFLRSWRFESAKMTGLWAKADVDGTSPHAL